MTDPKCELCGEEQDQCHCGDWETQRCERDNEQIQGLKTNESEQRRDDDGN